MLLKQLNLPRVGPMLSCSSHFKRNSLTQLLLNERPYAYVLLQQSPSGNSVEMFKSGRES